ncbi:hypothetical protein QZH41_001014 [Actinostola sp. cb2023]|nr:hypothetical protein QZH41_001014 [Actinostola sp. cb2023]
MKSSYSFYDKSRTDQQAVEELCSDLPPDAFEDDVMDDFGDDLTAEELSEAASVAEQTEQTFGVSKDRQTENNTKDQLAQQSNKGFDEDYFGDFDQDLELVENETLLVQNDFTSHFPFSSKGDEAKVKELATESTAVLFSADSHSTNHFASTCTNIGFNNGDRSNSAFTNSANGFGVERKSSDQINLLQEKLQKREQKVVMLVENFMSSNNEALPYLAECHCSIELLKLLVCLLDKEVVFLQQFPLESLMNNPKTRLLADLRMLVGHKYNNLIISSLRLLNGLKDIPENEVLIDLLDFENIEDSEVLGEDGVEDMEVGE